MKTDGTVAQVCDAAKDLIDSNDKLSVIDVTGANWGTWDVQKDVTDWMKQNVW